MSLQKKIEKPYSSSSSSSSIPIINFKALIEDGKVFELENLHAACKDWGVFQLANHGISFSLMNKLDRALEEFYESSPEEKMKYAVLPGTSEGYGHVVHGKEKSSDCVERFYMTTYPIHKRKAHLFPQLPITLRESLEVYLSELQEVAKVLLSCIAETLKIDKEVFQDMFDDGKQSIRMNNYPPNPRPELVTGLAPHSDGAALTIVHQLNGVDGLQVRQDGIWMPVQFLPNCFVVNLGDIIEIWSNGAYKSLEHRVTVHEAERRTSIGVFYNPNLDAQIGPALSLISEANPPLFKTVTMDKYLEGFFSKKLTVKTFLEDLRIQKI